MKIFNLIFIILFVIICNSIFQHGCDSISNSSEGDPEVNLILDNYSYFVGDTLTGKIEVTNNSDEFKSFSFGSACQYGIRIKDTNTIYFELPRQCAAVLTELHLKSGETRSFNLHFKLMDQDYKDLNTGHYTVQAFLLIENSDIAEKIIEIK